ncbi:DMT family transporter [Yoonia sp. R2331]|uniref:DMT family transporter n=1 Tax=Yoonia sp. R2331 TaxID=3237238 RepID=UPI0034E4D3A6
MIWFVLIAFLGGASVSLSRQINGRLSLSTSALHSSFWNHIVGLGLLTCMALVFGGLFTPGIADIPSWAYLGGTVGVVFIALSSWLVARIGAAQTALLIIAGQMISGVVLDIVMGAPGQPLARVAGVALILAGMWLSQKKR